MNKAFNSFGHMPSKIGEWRTRSFIGLSSTAKPLIPTSILMVDMFIPLQMRTLRFHTKFSKVAYLQVGESKFEFRSIFWEVYLGMSIYCGFKISEWTGSIAKTIPNFKCFLHIKTCCEQEENSTLKLKSSCKLTKGYF